MIRLYRICLANIPYHLSLALTMADEHKREESAPLLPPPPPPLPPSQPARIVWKFSPPTVYLDSLASAGPNFFNKPPFPTPPPLDVGPQWYFFYGTLTDPQPYGVFSTSHKTPSSARPPPTDTASRCGASARPSWTGRQAGQTVQGFAFLVQSAEDEVKLARDETSAYEVRHCKMYFEDGEEPSTLRGYTFKYAGDAEALKEGRFDRKLWQRTSGVALPDTWHRDDTDKVRRR